MDGSQIVLPIYGCDDIRRSSGLKGQEMRGGREMRGREGYHPEVKELKLERLRKK